MKNKSLISVIIPIYNGEAYLTDCISSILDQTYKPIEIIAVDDGSKDRSAEIIKSFKKNVRYFFQVNSGTAAARNHGIKMAKGSYFAFLDQDDLWVQNKLMMQTSAFEKDLGLDVVFGHVQQFHSPELDLELKENLICPTSLMPGYLPSSMLIKKEAFFKVGLFESAWQIGEWANWYVRASEIKLKTMMLSELVALRRIHATNKGVLQRNNVTEYIHILKASLDRRRSIK